MEVKVSFDTEKESISDLKKFISYVQCVIDRRENNQILNNESSLNKTTNSSQTNVPVKSKTSGGGRVIPYEDMSEKLSQILSGKY